MQVHFTSKREIGMSEKAKKQKKESPSKKILYERIVRFWKAGLHFRKECNSALRALKFSSFIFDRRYLAKCLQNCTEEIEEFYTIGNPLTPISVHFHHPFVIEMTPNNPYRFLAARTITTAAAPQRFAAKVSPVIQSLQIEEENKASQENYSEVAIAFFLSLLSIVNATPHFVLTFDWFLCMQPRVVTKIRILRIFDQLRQPIAELDVEDNEKFAAVVEETAKNLRRMNNRYNKLVETPFQYLVQERLDVVLSEWMKTEWLKIVDLNERWQALYSIYFQLIHALSVAQQWYQFGHNDLHHGNVMLLKFNTQDPALNPEDVELLYYISDRRGERTIVKKLPLSQTQGHIIKIIDFGRSRMEVIYQGERVVHTGAATSKIKQFLSRRDVRLFTLQMYQNLSNVITSKFTSEERKETNGNRIFRKLASLMEELINWRPPIAPDTRPSQALVNFLLSIPSEEVIKHLTRLSQVEVDIDLRQLLMDSEYFREYDYKETEAMEVKPNQRVVASPSINHVAIIEELSQMEISESKSQTEETEESSQSKEEEESETEKITISSSSSSSLLSLCNQCDALLMNGGGDGGVCSKCMKVFYCSTVCQQLHWSVHQLECK